MTIGRGSRSRELKLARLRTGAAPRLLELASGAGGLALGLRTVGFELTAHVEVDETATETYRLNFRPESALDDGWSIARDMTDVSAEQIALDVGLESATAAFDVLAAGLPCQAFARIGRSKLRAVKGEDDAFRTDERAGLYRHFLQYVAATDPLVVVIENVPDILNFGGHNIPEEICASLEGMGYRSAYTILNAAHFGVPQIRERLFLLAYARELDVEPRFPIPTRHLDLPKGYEGSRAFALKHIPREQSRFIGIQEPPRHLPPAVTAHEALADLPTITEHVSSSEVLRRRRLGDRLPYRPGRPTAYQKVMRSWPGFETGGDSSGHVVRLNPRDYATFRAMPHAADYPVALRVAAQRYRDAVEQFRREDRPLSENSRRKLWFATVPPYDPGKFPNKWWKLHPDRPSRTLTAHLGKDTYSHIHYDGQQARTISVREAARLQSFPDGFEFAGSMGMAFRQIGNAVPALLARAIGQTIHEQLTEVIGSEAQAQVA